MGWGGWRCRRRTSSSGEEWTSHPGKAQSSSHRRWRSSQQACRAPPTPRLQWSRRGLHCPGRWICPPDCHCRSRSQRSGCTVDYQRGSRWRPPHRSFWWWLVNPRWSAHHTAGPRWCSRAQKIHRQPGRSEQENKSCLPGQLTEFFTQTAPHHFSVFGNGPPFLSPRLESPKSARICPSSPPPVTS